MADEVAHAEGSGELVHKHSKDHRFVVILAKRIAKRIQTWISKRTQRDAHTHPCTTVDESWREMWEFLGPDDKGCLTYADFVDRCFPVLKMAGEYTPHVMKALWAYCDKDGQGKLTWSAFATGFYRIFMATYPEITQPGLERLVGILAKQAADIHHFGGNWFIFLNHNDIHGETLLDFPRLSSLLRHQKPGLHVAQRLMSDEELHALWLALDANLVGKVSGNDLVRFLRYHGQHTGSTRKGSQSLTNDQLRAVARKLNAALAKWFATRGHSHGSGQSSLADPNLRWCILLHMVDTDGSRRVDEKEFLAAVRDVLKVGREALSDHELRGYFASVSVGNGRTALTSEEFALGVYRSEVDTWPTFDEKVVSHVVHIIGERAIHWHFANRKGQMSEAFASWFKLLSAQNKTEDRHSSSRHYLSFNDFVGMIRSNKTGLHIEQILLSDDQVRGLWKAIDVDRLGRVSFAEFMRFFRMSCHDQGTCGGPVLLKTGRDRTMCPAEILAVQASEKLAKPDTAAGKRPSSSQIKERKQWHNIPYNPAWRTGPRCVDAHKSRVAVIV